MTRPLRNLISRLRSKIKQSQIKKILPRVAINKLKVMEYDLMLYHEIVFGNRNKKLSEKIKALTRPGKRILFYPETPWEGSMISHICFNLGYKITDNLSRPADLVIHWKSATFHPPDRSLYELKKKIPVINLELVDISKSHVADVFRQVFGYSLEIDPRVYEGICVQKSNLNARHDGRIANCPLQFVEEGYVYQILVDNEVEGEMVMDIRVPIFKDQIPYVCYRYRPKAVRFTAELAKSELVETADAFTPPEQKMIILFCNRLGLDYGELDVLRDNGNGRIYIVDANNTPHHGYSYRSAAHLDGVDGQMITRQAKAFADMLQNKTRQENEITNGSTFTASEDDLFILKN